MTSHFKAETTMSQYLFVVPSTVDLGKLASAWQHSAESLLGLDTRVTKQCTSLEGIEGTFEWEITIASNDLVREEHALLPPADHRHRSRLAVCINPRTQERILSWTPGLVFLGGDLRNAVLSNVHAIYNGITSMIPRTCTHIGQFYDEMRPSKESHSIWAQYLANLESSTFPEVRMSAYVPVAKKIVKHQTSVGSGEVWRYKPETLAYTALAVLLSKYTDTTDVLYGIISHETCPKCLVPVRSRYTNTSIRPFRVTIRGEQNISVLLRRVEEQERNLERHRPLGLDEMKALSDQFCFDIQALLNVRREDSTSKSWENLMKPLSNTDLEPPVSGFGVLFDCKISDHTMDLTARFDTNLLKATQVERILKQFGHLIKQINDHIPEKALKDLDLMPPEELEDIAVWNPVVLRNGDSCIHDVIRLQGDKRPHKIAISGWDANLTYAELDQYSTFFALHLIELGVRSSQYIPICFDKSAWTLVVILGVSKAGGIFTLVDPSLPKARLSAICGQMPGCMAVVSGRTKDVMRTCVNRFIEVDEDFLRGLQYSSNRSAPRSLPESAAYILFTSGSTGSPKGAIIEHRGFTSCAMEFGRAMGFDEQTRALQFASYSFGASLVEMIVTLMFGGCVFIPSDEERLNGLTSFIRRQNVNWAVFTPSFVRVLQPESVQSIETLVLGGEPIGADIVEKWINGPRLIQVYGQSETASVCSCTTVEKDGDVQNIGRPKGARLWIVDTLNSDALVPVGCVGEIVVESTGVARGYLNAKKDTEAVFIQRPAWYSHFRQQNDCRFYKTGDLGAYEPDGTIRLIGRKDLQVKIRGQRVELHDIEHHLRRLCPEKTKVVVDLVTLAQGGSPILVAFVQESSEKDSSAEYTLLSPDRAVQLTAQLRATVPSHSIPARYVLVECMPMTPTGKTNRKVLKEMGAQCIYGDIEQAQSSRSTQQTTNKTERELQKLWAQVLKHEKAVIGSKSDFFGIGGDSITAQSLVDEARKRGIHLRLEDILQHTVLEDMAAVVQIAPIPENRVRGTSQPKPFSMFKEERPLKDRLNVISEMCNINSRQIEDIYGCTPMQEFIVATDNDNAWVRQLVFRLNDNETIDKFISAWKDTVHANPILRSRICYIEERHEYVQAVINESAQWSIIHSTLEYFLEQDAKTRMALGSIFFRYTIVIDKNENGEECQYFVWTVHHSLCDGASIVKIMDEVVKRYQGISVVQRESFQNFIHFVTVQPDREQEKKFWQKSLLDLNPSIYPPPSQDPSFRANPKSKLTQILSLGSRLPSGLSKALLLRAAWAILLHFYTGTEEVIFGAINDGRRGDVQGVSHMTGPTINLVPVALNVDHKQSITSFLSFIKQQSIEMSRFEHTGISKIRNYLVGQASRATDFQALLVVHPKKVIDAFTPFTSCLGLQYLADLGKKEQINFPLVASFRLSTSMDVLLELQYDDRILSSQQAQSMVHQFQRVLTQLCNAEEDELLGSISPLSEYDTAQIIL